MAHSENTTRSRLLTFVGAVGALLIFALLLLIAYIPNRPAAVDAEINAARKAKAAEAIAQGKAKLYGYAVIDADQQLVRIPIERAMLVTVENYQKAAEN
jgi:hypothetical protein